MNRNHIISTVFAFAIFISGPKAEAADSIRSKTQGPLVKSPGRSDLDDFWFWAARYTRTTDPADSRLIAEGIRLADRRRAAVSELIRSDPEQALETSPSLEILRALPREVTAHLERRVSGIGDFEVLCPFPASAHQAPEPMRSVVRLHGVTYSAHVYGRREFQDSKTGVPLHGVVVDGEIALGADVLRELGPGESPEPGQPMIDVGLQGAAGKSVLAEAGGKVFRFASRDQLRQAEVLLEAMEEGEEPDSGDALTAILQQNLEYKIHEKPKRQPRAAVNVVPPTVIRILVIRTDLPDKPGDSDGGNNTADYVQSVMDNYVGPYFTKSSYGRVRLQTTVTAKLYRLPGTAVWYGSDYYVTQLKIDAWSAAAPDYTLADYDRIVYLFPDLMRQGLPINWGGLADVPGSWVCVNGYFLFNVLAHELGHTLGLHHANIWHVNDGDPVSRAGFDDDHTVAEYQDLFDTMGAGVRDTRVDFNAYSKYQLNWIDDSQVQSVTTSGVYRVHRIDGPTANAVVALKVIKDDLRNYWISCRRNFTENTSLMHGAYIIWGYNTPFHTAIIDTVTPDNQPRDAALPIDRTLIDRQANLTIETVGEGGDSPNEYIDVQITFGPPPVISMQSAPESIDAGQGATFRVQASGNPPPAYQWQFKAHGTTAWLPLNDNEIYDGSQSTSLVMKANLYAETGDEYRCVLTNSSGGFNCTQPMVLNVLEAPPILQIEPVGDQVVLSWAASADQYVLEASTDLVGAPWVALTNGITLSEGIYTLTLPADQESAFFRLRR